jgi:hypothetical protein
MLDDEGAAGIDAASRVAAPSPARDKCVAHDPSASLRAGSLPAWRMATRSPAAWCSQRTRSERLVAGNILLASDSHWRHDASEGDGQPTLFSHRKLEVPVASLAIAVASLSVSPSLMKTYPRFDSWYLKNAEARSSFLVALALGLRDESGKLPAERAGQSFSYLYGGFAYFRAPRGRHRCDESRPPRPVPLGRASSAPDVS